MFELDISLQGTWFALSCDFSLPQPFPLKEKSSDFKQALKEEARQLVTIFMDDTLKVSIEAFFFLSEDVASLFQPKWELPKVLDLLLSVSNMALQHLMKTSFLIALRSGKS